MRIASRRCHVRLATVAANPAGISSSFFLVSPFFPSLFSLSSFSFLFFLLFSSFFSLLLSAHARPSPVPCAAAPPLCPRVPRAAGCSARRSASARAVPSPVLLPRIAPPLRDATTSPNAINDRREARRPAGHRDPLLHRLASPIKGTPVCSPRPHRAPRAAPLRQLSVSLNLSPCSTNRATNTVVDLLHKAITARLLRR